MRLRRLVGGSGRHAVRAGQHEIEAFSPGPSLRRFSRYSNCSSSCRTIWRINGERSAHFVTQAGRGAGQHAHEIERIALSERFLLDQAGRAIRTARPVRRRRLEQIQEPLRMVRVIGEGAQGRCTGLRARTAIHWALW